MSCEIVVLLELDMTNALYPGALFCAPVANASTTPTRKCELKSQNLSRYAIRIVDY